tara:strand:- start:234 stop:404 length:171 start_codon:yes stop_codon:yes gene_type:complete
MNIIKCTNGVGAWEIDETHDTFDTYEEAEAALITYKRLSYINEPGDFEIDNGVLYL